MKVRESVHQKNLCAWLDACQILYCHVPNGGFRRPIEAAMMQGQGVKPGVPDILIFETPPNAQHCKGVALEMKAQGGRLTDKQMKWLERMGDAGWITMVAYSAQEAVKELKTLGYGPKRWAA